MTAKRKDGISEDASEKRKRGRPPVFDPEERKLSRSLWPRIKSYRGQSDQMYRGRAVLLLWEDARFAWVADRAKMTAGEPGAYKPAILSELGRIPDEEDLKAVALRICELKPKTKDAVSMIRRARLGREAPSDPWKLFRHLAGAVDAYSERHPSTPDAALVKGLRDMADFIEDGGTE